jgi:F-type H+-transporting ATPase subunit j
MWPFMAAAGITFYLVSKGQAMGIRCMSFLVPVIVLVFDVNWDCTAPEYRNDPKNPYAAQIAKEEAH